MPRPAVLFEVIGTLLGSHAVGIWQGVRVLCIPSNQCILECQLSHFCNVAPTRKKLRRLLVCARLNYGQHYPWTWPWIKGMNRIRLYDFAVTVFIVLFNPKFLLLASWKLQPKVCWASPRPRCVLRYFPSTEPALVVPAGHPTGLFDD